MDERCRTVLLAAISALAWAIPATTALATDAPGLDKWGTMESSDAITDQKLISAGVGTKDGLILMFQCSGAKDFGVVLLPTDPETQLAFITMDRTTEVAWRVDAQPAKIEQWLVLPGRPKSSYAVVSESDALAKAVVSGANTLTVRVHKMTSSIKLEGAIPYVLKVLSICGRKAPIKAS